MLLENLINKAIVHYKLHNLAIFHKNELPIKFSSIKNVNGRLNVEGAWIQQKSTADYYGVWKGYFLAFEAKSTRENYLMVSTIKYHQYNYLVDIFHHGGIAFFVIGFTSYDLFFLIQIEQIMTINAKRITIELAHEIGVQISLNFPGWLDFLQVVAKIKQSNSTTKG